MSGFFTIPRIFTTKRIRNRNENETARREKYKNIVEKRARTTQERFERLKEIAEFQKISEDTEKLYSETQIEILSLRLKLVNQYDEKLNNKLIEAKERFSKLENLKKELEKEKSKYQRGGVKTRKAKKSNI
jgi:hypothetical protein